MVREGFRQMICHRSVKNPRGNSQPKQWERISETEETLPKVDLEMEPVDCSALKDN